MIDWRQWGHEPLLLTALIVLAAAGAGFVRENNRRALLWAGCMTAYLAVGPPWEQAGRFYLFSVQMAQHLVLIYGAAALIVAGGSGTIGGERPAPADAGPVGRGRGRRSASSGGALRSLACGVLFILGTAAFYLPRVHGRLLLSEAGMALEHLALLALGIIFWWPVLSRSPRYPALRYGPRLLYLLVIEVALAGVFSYFLMAEHPIYPAYELAPRLVPKLTPEEDQVLAGVMLSAVGSLVLVGALGAAFFAWAKESE